jgi:hypothetical protein
MGRRRRNSTDEIATLVVMAVIVLGFGVIHFARIMTSFGIAVVLAGAAALSAFGLYWVGRKLWENLLNLPAWTPDIDWQLPAPEAWELHWPKITHPQFANVPITASPQVIGTGGAWKEVEKMLEPFPFLSASTPDDLKSKIGALESAVEEMIRRVMTESVESIAAMQLQAAKRRQQAQLITTQYERSIRAKLTQVGDAVREMENEGGWLNRIRVGKLRALLVDHETQLAIHLSEYRHQNEQWERQFQMMLNPQTREQYYQGILTHELNDLRAILQSNDYSGSVAEVAVIEQLKSLPPSCVVINDLRLESSRYIHFEGKPLMSAQIDTLVITSAGVFVVEVKNWSKEFAESGQGFNPFEQVSRAGYLVYDRLRAAGIQTRVTSIITSMGRLPARNGEKVVVKPVRYLREFILSRPETGLDVALVKAVLLKSA